MPRPRNTLAALAAASAVAAQSTTIDIFVPGNLPGLEGPGSVVEASPEITVVALGCSGEGDCPLTVHQGASTWSMSQSGTVIDCQLDVPDDVANCEWDTPLTSIVGELPGISELFIPMEITAGVDNLPGGGGGGSSETPAPTSTSGESSPTETPAPPPSTPSEPTTVLPTTSEASGEPVPTTPVTTIPDTVPGTETGEITLPVISSSSGFPNGTTFTTSASSTGGEGGDQPAPTDGDGGEEPAPTDGDGGEEPAPTDTPAAAAKATGSIFIGGLALLAAFAL